MSGMRSTTTTRPRPNQGRTWSKSAKRGNVTCTIHKLERWRYGGTLSVSSEISCRASFPALTSSASRLSTCPNPDQVDHSRIPRPLRLSLVPLIRAHVHKRYSLALVGPVPRPRNLYEHLFPKDPTLSLDALRHLEIYDYSWLRLDNLHRLSASNLATTIMACVSPLDIPLNWWSNVTYLQMTECPAVAEDVLDVLQRTNQLRKLAIQDIDWFRNTVDSELPDSLVPIPRVSL